MTESITFLHAADLHLDSPFIGMSNVPPSLLEDIRQSTFQAFDHLIETAIDQRVDFVLLVGDLYDQAQQSLKAQMHLKRGFERLSYENIFVYLSYGNHDFIKSHTFPIEFPENVFVFPDEQIRSFTFYKNNRPMANIYGFSYVSQAVTKNKAKEYKTKDPSIPFHIAMLHGSLHGKEGHEPYAPFRLEDLRQKPFHYWALGHIHKRDIVQEQPPIIYPGNIQGRHRNELGNKGCYYVEMNRIETKVSFVPLQAITFEQFSIECSEESLATNFEELIYEKIKQSVSNPHLLHMTCILKENRESAALLQERMNEWIELVNENLLQQRPWQFIYSYHFEKQQKDIGYYDHLFLNEIQKAVQTLDTQQEIVDLFLHPRASKYLAKSSDQNLKQQAYEWLIDHLSKEYGE